MVKFGNHSLRISSITTIALILINVVLLIANIIWLRQNTARPASHSDQYPFLSRRIFAENQNDILINFIPLRTALQEYVAKQNNTLGVYFEYLPSGASVSANGQMEVHLASLIKVPLVMAVYKEIENRHLNLDTSLVLEEDMLDSSFGDLWKKGAGTKITVKEAINLALAQSDNTASRLLEKQLPPGSVEEVFRSLNIPPPIKGGAQVVSPKDYSSVLRSLYLSAYLSRTSSNEILGTLAATSFRDKLPAGIPFTIKVAHKIGVWQDQYNQPVFSDCGIIYTPNRPFLLCIMSQNNEETARDQMQRIAKMTYDYIDNVGR